MYRRGIWNGNTFAALAIFPTGLAAPADLSKNTAVIEIA
jgi:hypothetical protein